MLANLRACSGHLLHHSLRNARIPRRSWASTTAGKDQPEEDSLTIGDVSVRLRKPKDPQLVPQQYGEQGDAGKWEAKISGQCKGQHKDLGAAELFHHYHYIMSLYHL